MVRLWFDEKLTNQTHQPSSPTWLSTGFHGLDTCFSNYRLAAVMGTIFSFRNNLQGFLSTPAKRNLQFNIFPKLFSLSTFFGHCLSHQTPIFCHSGR
jgi:hypothetical protein